MFSHVFLQYSADVKSRVFLREKIRGKQSFHVYPGYEKRVNDFLIFSCFTERNGVASLFQGVMSSDQVPRVLNLSSLSYFIMSNPEEYKMIMQQRTPNQIPR